jgi:hypothetical protein
MDTFEDLIDRKIILEERIKILSKELGVLKTGALTDMDGYPVEGIDFRSVLARSELSRAQNDYKEVMRDIEKQLPLALSSGRKYSTRPFAIVTQIDRSSLAEQAGMMMNDKILQLDSITLYEELSGFSIGEEIYVKVLRGVNIIKLQSSNEFHSRLGARLEKY